MERRLWRLLAAFFAFALLAAACADDDDDAASDDSADDGGGDGDEGDGGDDDGDDGGGDVAYTDVDVFYLPPVSDEFGDPLLTAGTFATAFSADEDTMAALEYLASPAYVEARLAAGAGGFLSANSNVDPSAFDGFDATLVEILQNADTARFDGSDDMPGEVGAGSFWTAATSITAGNESVEDAFADIEGDFPEIDNSAPDCGEVTIEPGDGTVTIFGPEVEAELAAFQASMEPFTEETGIAVEIQGDRSFSEQIGVQVEGGNPPDIAIFAQPGRVREFARSCDLVPLADNVVTEMNANFNEGFTVGGQVNGVPYGVPNKSDVKSLVWYSPTAFADNGYAVPETHDDLVALMDQMVEDGNTPLCIGIGSDAATGWPFTDWIEDYMLRLQGPDVYDQWVRHEIPFDDPMVVEVGNFVMDIWSNPDYVFGGQQTIANTPFAESGLGVVEGDCMLHRQANFFAAQWPDGVTVGSA